MAADACTTLDLGEITMRYRDRSLSPVEVTRAFLERIDRLNPSLDAFVHIDPEGAMAAARAAEARFATGQAQPLLCGVPVSIKDTLPTGGMRTTFGSPLFRDFVPAEDCAAVDLVRRAGAVILGKTNTPTLGWMGITQNKLFGPARNPWNTAHNAGGSSGGCAASAAARLAPVNIGTDGGGSLRIPASFTGTVGYKASYGRVPNWPTGPNWSLQHIGPIATSVRDAAMVLDALKGPDDRDPYCLPASGVTYADLGARGSGPKRVLFAPDLGFAEAVEPEVIEVCREAVRSLADCGHHVTEQALSWPSPMRAWETMFLAGVALRLGPFMATRADDVEETLREYVARGQRLGPTEYFQAWLDRNEFWEHVRRTFAEYDFLVTPATACPALPIGRETAGTVAGKPVSFYGWMPFCAAFNLTGQPAVSVPAGTTKAGLPVGMQIVAPRFADEALLGIAAEYEAARPWPRFAPAFV